MNRNKEEDPSSARQNEEQQQQQQRQRDPSENALTGNDGAIQTAKWTRWLPEAYGIRQAVEQSKYRWCAREAGLWGIATGTAMSLHRFRMASPTTTAVHAGFATTFVVYLGSYYFCAKRRDYQEQMIELMMRLNTFEPATSMPEERPLDETHPFVEPASQQGGSGIPERQFVANLPERKEWQSPLPTQDADRVFQPTAAAAKGDEPRSKR